MVVLGVALYVLSRTFPLLFGLIEILVGVGGVIYTFYTSLQGLNKGGYEMLPDPIQIAVAIYFLVQGLKDTSDAFDPGARTRRVWDKIFPSA